MTAPTALAPRRVLLTADELDLLCRLAGDLPLPVDFRLVPRQPHPAGGRPVGVLCGGATGLVGSLRERRLVQPDPPMTTDPDRVAIHPSVRANLAVLAAPEVLIETRVQADVDGAARVVRAAHGVAGELGGSLVRVAESAAVELSIFPAVGLGAELLRVVPPVGSPERADQRPSGVVPLAALTQLGLAEQAGPDVVAEVLADLRLGAGEQARARALLEQARGVLQATVLVRPRVPGGPVELGQVLWYATPGGWVGLAPEPGARGEATVRLRPAGPEDLGGWLAPLVGQAIL
jgi:hypothetical protein